MTILRAPGGCPWDIEQTHESIRRNFIEEVYEACEAIDLQDDTLLCEELGDVLLQVVFHARIAEDRGAFSISDVCDGVCRKLILRHPHIFGEEKDLKTADQVLDRWDEIKKAEKHQKSVSQAMDQVAKTLPALIYAEKIQKKAAKSGSDIRPEPASSPEEEIGNKLFAVVAEARERGIDPEKALSDVTKAFVKQFSKQELADKK